jgi:hypothetical protein
LGRQLETEHEDYGDDHTHRRRMTDSPNEAQAGGAPEPGARTRRKRGNGSQMVGFEGVPEAEEQANPADGE